MTIVRFAKYALIVIVLCTSCSSGGQTSPKVIEVDDSVNKQTLSVGIENVDAVELSASAIRFYVINNSSDDARMLIWGTPFEQRLSADILLVSSQGEVLPYLGRMVKRGEPTDEDYLIVPAGQRQDVLLDLSVSYGVSTEGEYKVKLKLNKIDDVFKINQETAVNILNAELLVQISH